MPAPPSSKQRSANEKSMAASKAKSNSYGNINTSTVKTQDRGSTNSYGKNTAQRQAEERSNYRSPPSTPSKGLLSRDGNNFGGINTAKLKSQSLLGTPSPTLQKAMDRSKSNMLSKQYGQYRSGASNEYGEDLTRNAYDAENPVKPFRSGATEGTPPGYAQKYFQERYAPQAPQTQQPGQSYSGPKGGLSLLPGARMAAANMLGYKMPDVARTPGDSQLMAKMALAESGSIKNDLGGYNTEAMQGTMDVMRNRMLSGRYPDSVRDVIMQKNQFSPVKDGSFARANPDHSMISVADSVLSGETPSAVGGALNYGNLDTINRKPGYSSNKTKQAFNSMNPEASFADANNPRLQHSFGTIGRPSDVALYGGSQPTMTASRYPSEVAPASGPPTPRQKPMQQMASINPAGGPPAPQQTQSDTGPSLWESYAPDMLKTAVTAVDQNLIQPTKEQVAKYGGFERAGKLAQMAVGIMNFLPGGTPPKMAPDSNPNGNASAMQLAQQQPMPQAPAAVAGAPQQAATVNQTQPWRYPQYSQQWAGLPKGIGGYARG